VKLNAGTIILGIVLLGGGYFAYTRFIRPHMPGDCGPAYNRVGTKCVIKPELNVPPPGSKWGVPYPEQAARARAYAAFEQKEAQPHGLWTDPYSPLRNTNPRYKSRLVARARALNARTLHSNSAF